MVILLQQMKTWDVSGIYMPKPNASLCVGLYSRFLKSIGKDKAKYEAVNRQDDEEDFGGLEEDVESLGGNQNNI